MVVHKPRFSPFLLPRASNFHFFHDRDPMDRDVLEVRRQSNGSNLRSSYVVSVNFDNICLNVFCHILLFFTCLIYVWFLLLLYEKASSKSLVLSMTRTPYESNLPRNIQIHRKNCSSDHPSYFCIHSNRC